MGSSFPNWNLFIENAWAPGGGGCPSNFYISTNVVVGVNPPYNATDFLAIYPNFGGTPLILSGVITQGSAVMTGLSTTAGILPGQPLSPNIPFVDPTTFSVQLVAGSFPNGTIVKSVDSATQLTMSLPASVNGTTIAVYNAPLIPFLVLNIYIALASSCLVQNRYMDMWPMVMALFIAHYATLYLRSAGYPGSTAAQLVSAGLAKGILVSKSAGGVSAGIQPVTTGYQSWGAWGTTAFGEQLLPIFASVGAGCIFLF